jgi:Flp pilus assembly protein TadB
MGWLMLVGLGIIWAAFLLPMRRSSPHRSVEDFERRMDLLAETDGGRWIVTPQKGMPFLGSRARAQARARERRRKVLVFLGECIGLTFLIGLVPPLRPVWYASGVLAALLGAYVWMLLSIRQRASELDTRDRVRAVNAVPARPIAARFRHASDAAGRTREVFNGLGTFGTDDPANIVVRIASRPDPVRV